VDRHGKHYDGGATMMKVIILIVAIAVIDMIFLKILGMEKIDG